MMKERLAPGEAGPVPYGKLKLRSYNAKASDYLW